MFRLLMLNTLRMHCTCIFRIFELNKSFDNIDKLESNYLFHIFFLYTLLIIALRK